MEEAPRRREPRRLLWRDRRGAAALEAAAVAPLLLFVIGASADFGRALSQGVELTNAVRAGGQYAVTSPQFTTPQGGVDPVTQAVKNALPANLQSATVTMTCHCGVLMGATDLPAEIGCDKTCEAPKARLMRITAELPFTPMNPALTPVLARRFGLDKVSSNVTVRHQ